MTGGRVYGGESAADRSARRRQQFLEGGLEVFGTTGFRTATVRQICRAAGVSDRYFAEQFGSTEDLLVAVYGMCLDRLRNAVVAALTLGGDIVVLAAAALEALLGEAEDDPRLVQVVWFEVLGVSDRIEAMHLERLAEFGELLIAMLPGRLSLADATEGEIRVVVDAAIGAVSHTVVAWLRAGFEPARPLVAATLAQFLVGGADGIGGR